MILSKKRISKALIRLRGCAGWSAPVLFATPRRQVFSRQGPLYKLSVYNEMLNEILNSNANYAGFFVVVVVVVVAVVVVVLKQSTILSTEEMTDRNVHDPW